jgi:NAD(P)-dependent dehydrogenase (short-subunit alcohol dehydrogenase family)
MFDLEDRVVLLTGAAGYLGRAMSRAILQAGAHVIVTGRRENALTAHRDILPPEFRKRCHIMTIDVTHVDAPAQIKSKIEGDFGLLHGIVNNAYAGKVGEMNCIAAEDFFLACSYNLVAPFALVRALAPLLQSSARSRAATTSVVNVASMYGSVSPDPSIYAESGKNNSIHYGASKAGMIQMTRYLACHLGQHGVRVNSIAPGPFLNPETDPGIPGFCDHLAMKVPMGRVGKPEEVAGPVVFLLSDAAAYINGANLAVDGGWTAW